MTILETLVPSIFGCAFDGPTWDAWRVALKAFFGLPMTPAELAIFEACTGRTIAPTEQAREAWFAIGRRGGKSRVAALIAVFLAVLRDYSDVLAPGEMGTVAIIAADRRQARTVLRYINGLIDGSPMLAKLVVNRTAESIELVNGIVLEVHTASFRSVRGYTVVAAVLDEVAFWRSDDSANPDREIVAALRPAMALVPGALLIAISSPYSRHGILWDAHRLHHGRDGDPILTWRAESRTMNPLLPLAVIDQAMAEDEAAARAEYLAEWRSDVDRLIPPEAVDACVIPGRLELPPSGAVSYQAFVDPSGGSSDAMTLAIAHTERRGEQTVAVLDCMREVRPPFSPDAVTREFADTVKAYRCHRVTGDAYGGEWPRERFRDRGIEYAIADKNKSELYLAAVPLLNARRCELLDVPRLRVQLVGLERRTARGGRDSVDHGPGAHDDLANAAAGALVLALGPAVDGFYNYLMMTPEERERIRRECEARREREAPAPVHGLRVRVVGGDQLHADAERERRLVAYERAERAARRRGIPLA